MKENIKNAINEISTMEEMNEVIDLINMKQRTLRSIKEAINKSSIHIGSEVKVTGRTGIEIGKVIQIKRTKAIVEIDGSRWNCPISVLEAV
jgi:hypothetical protein